MSVSVTCWTGARSAPVRLVFRARLRHSAVRHRVYVPADSALSARPPPPVHGQCHHVGSGGTGRRKAQDVVRVEGRFSETGIEPNWNPSLDRTRAESNPSNEGSLTTVAVLLATRRAKDRRHELRPSLLIGVYAYQYEAKMRARAVSRLCPVYFQFAGHTAPPAHDTRNQFRWRWCYWQPRWRRREAADRFLGHHEL